VLAVHVRCVVLRDTSVLMPYYTSRLLQVISELRNLEGGSFTRDFERWVNGTLKDRASVSEGAVRGTWREGSFTVDSEGYAK
jgi:hypothetical protein